eukprot:gene2634-3323_t
MELVPRPCRPLPKKRYATTKEQSPSAKAVQEWFSQLGLRAHGACFEGATFEDIAKLTKGQLEIACPNAGTVLSERMQKGFTLLSACCRCSAGSGFVGLIVNPQTPCLRPAAAITSMHRLGLLALTFSAI